MLTKYTTTTLNISTAHIRLETDSRLHDNCEGGLSLTTSDDHCLEAFTTDNGWKFGTVETQSPAASAADLPELAALILFAAIRGFDYLEIDSNNETLPTELGFPVFDW